MAPRAIVAVDPGCLHTGVVYMDGIGVIDSETIAFKTGVRGDNGLLDERCEEIWRRLRAFLEGHPHGLVVVEGYQQQGGRGHMSMSHQTPWLVGSITAHLHQAGEPLAIQLSARVLNPKARGNCAWAADAVKQGRDVMRGCREHVTNEHLRSAFAHGLWRLTQDGAVESARGFRVPKGEEHGA